MTDNERLFGRDIALMAKKKGFTPGQMLAVFGAIAGHAVEFEVLEGRADQGAAIDTAIAIFTESMLITIHKPKATKQ